VPVLELGATKLAVFICYEDMLPSTVRDATMAGAALLVSISNDAWFGESRAAYTHFAAARLRAIELRRSLVRATNTGVTAIIEPTGRLSPSTLAPEHVPATRVASVPLLDGQTPYARFGSSVVIAVLLAWLALAFVTSRRAPRTAATA
jgi:apolipoprotein N-acyltransferase